MSDRALLRPLTLLAVVGLTGALGACSYMPQFKSLQDVKLFNRTANTPEVLAPVKERPETLIGVTAANTLVTFQASEPGRLLSSLPIQGLKAGEEFLGIDFRVAKGQLFGLTNQGRLLQIDPDKATVTPVGAGITLPEGQTFGFDFNPTVDRIRVVNDAGHNLRLHPETGAQVDGDANTPGVQPDGTLRYAPGDLLNSTKPRIVSAGYTYNKTNEKLTTNYAIDAGAGYLVVQGSLEGAATAVSPNTGLLQAIGPLLIERFDSAALDISDVNNAAYLATSRQDGREPRLYEVNLGSGQARLIGTIGTAQGLRGMAIVP